MNCKTITLCLFVAGCSSSGGTAAVDGMVSVSVDGGTTEDSGFSEDASPDAGVPTPTRYFANVPFVLDFPDAFVRAESIGEDSNMLALNFAAFDGTPWDSLINGSPRPARWQQSMDDTSALVESLDLPVYLAFTPFGDSYKVLSKDSATDVSPSISECEDLGAREDWPSLSAAYGTYIDEMVTRFNPKFLALSIELSGYFLDEDNAVDEACVSTWPALRDMFNTIYDAQKLKHPEMQIFHTFQIDNMWNTKSDTADCFGYVETCLTEKLALVSDLKMDLFGMSVYPLWSYVTHNKVLSDNYLSIFAEKTGLPLAVTETGWQYAPVTIDDPNDINSCIPILDASESSQSMWMNRLLKEAETLDMPLVVWWSNYDVLPAAVGENCRCSNSNWCPLLDLDFLTDITLRFFGTMGLRDSKGVARPCLQAWVDAVAAAAN